VEWKYNFASHYDQRHPDAPLPKRFVISNTELMSMGTRKRSHDAVVQLTKVIIKRGEKRPRTLAHKAASALE
jgi:hypothetical protein